MSENAPKVLGRAERVTPATRMVPVPEVGWAILGWVGLGLAIVSGWDVVLTWFPLRLGNAEWEFGTVSSSLNNLPALAIGIALILGAGLAKGIRWVVVSGAVVLIVLAVIVLGMGLLYLLDVPVALGAVEAGPVRLGLKKSILKTTLQAVLYPSVFIWIAVLAWRQARAGGKRGTEREEQR